MPVYRITKAIETDRKGECMDTKETEKYTKKQLSMKLIEKGYVIV